MVEATRVEPPPSVPVVLGLVAGYVDACTFISLFGLFVAQVTGSFVVIGLHSVMGNAREYAALFAVPAFFVAGMLAAFVAGGNEWRRRALPAVLMLELVFLAGFTLVETRFAPYDSVNAAPTIFAATLGLAAMGVQSALVRLAMSGIQSTNVMTTNTTQLSIDLAHWLMSLSRRANDPEAAALHDAARKRLAATGPVVLAFLVGTAAGALAYDTLGPWALLAPLLALCGLIAWAWRATGT